MRALAPDARKSEWPKTRHDPAPAFETLPRNQRRVLIAKELERRRTGNWPAWETISVPKGSVGDSAWLREIHTVYRNWVFGVLRRDLADGTVHLAISSLSQTRPTWWEAQRIKNDLAGPEATAVEVYPPQCEVVDQADMYHLWVLPSSLPFSIFVPPRRVSLGGGGIIVKPLSDQPHASPSRPAEPSPDAASNDVASGFIPGEGV